MKRSRAGKPKVVKKVTNNVTNNYTINIQKYFAPKPGPAPAPEAQPEVPPHLFPEGEREIQVPRHHGGTYRRVLSTRKGALFGDCWNCARKYKDIAEFAPDECNKNTQKRSKFFKAVAKYDEEYAARNLEGAREARDKINELRSERCPPCRKTYKKLSPKQKACRDCWVELRQKACALQGGCMKSGCRERGPNAWQVLEADHLRQEEKTHKLSDYVWWAYHGGPAAMRAEAAKCQWLCRFCHRLEKTSSAANRFGDPAAMPDGKYNGTEEERKQYMSKHNAKIVYPKQQYVDAEKLRRGCCLACERAVTPETTVAFDFDHRDPVTKMKGEDTLARDQGGVGGLVGNHVKRASLGKIKDVLDAEMDKCDLLCTNCHKRKTCKYKAESEDEDAEGGI